MSKLNKNIFVLALLTIETVIACTLLYYLGMHYLEGRPRTLLQSLEFVVQTMTTVGYGQDAPWNHSLMYILVLTTQMAGITLVFLSIPTVVTPWVEQRITIRPPGEYNGEKDHVIITEHTEIMDTLLNELEQRDIPYVLIDGDLEQTTELFRDGRSVIHADPEDPESFERAKVHEARLAILDGTDEQNASQALFLQDFEVDLPVIAIASQPERADHLSMAGVDDVIHPREKIGEVLALKALSGLGKSPTRTDESDPRITIREFPVLTSSPLINTRLKQTGIREQTGAHVVGVWRYGNFNHNPSADYRIKRNDILVAGGTPEQLDALGQLAESRALEFKRDKSKVMIIGYGKEGHAARNYLLEDGIVPKTVNDLDLENVDVVGDAMKPRTLKRAGIADTATVLITVSADDVAIMITLIVRKLNPQAEILVQVNQASSVEAIYRAGANYVLALDQLTSRLLAGTVMGEEVIHEELNVQIQRCSAGDLAGKTPRRERIGEKFKVAILGMERDGELLDQIEPDAKIQSEDVIYVAGEQEQVSAFRDHYRMKR